MPLHCFISHLFQNSRAKCHCKSKISFLKTAQLQKTIARLADVNQKAVSKAILKQCEESFSIERKRENGRSADQNKSKKKIRIFLKRPNISGRKVAPKVGFC